MSFSLSLSSYSNSPVLGRSGRRSLLLNVGRPAGWRLPRLPGYFQAVARTYFDHPDVFLGCQPMPDSVYGYQHWRALKWHISLRDNVECRSPIAVWFTMEIYWFPKYREDCRVYRDNLLLFTRKRM